jgi:iron complex outermembrane receptor protein
MIQKLFVNKVYILFIFLLSASAAMAQNFSVIGKVTDAAGKSLEGTTVAEKGKKVSTVTTSDGTLQLNVSSSNAKLVISFVGYEEQEIALNNQKQLSLTPVIFIK